FHARCCCLAIIPLLVVIQTTFRAYDPRDSGREISRIAALNVAITTSICAFVLWLSLRILPIDPLRPWPSSLAALYVGGVGAVLAWLRRRELWAFLGGLSVLLGTTLIVSHFSEGDSWVPFLQANTIAAAVVALVWLMAVPRLYGTSSWAPL